MHHIRHIRKTPYTGLQRKAFLQIMSLRNRKQIPVCRNCHINVIHAGRYSGTRLNRLILELNQNMLFDNRVIHVENFIHPGAEHFAASLEEKGFIPRPYGPISLPDVSKETGPPYHGVMVMEVTRKKKKNNLWKKNRND